ncbi:hypothetical protein CRM22_008966 [Opisthorchis felineus]|uniref:AB hydrolase-1 domain-containing protein n=2 Tax=Opisthorchis felineus TaxID=147828 RepID=A0A4S2LGP9_OPIFE|nr:hypothetical protein CRM22_008966 [Opisthorchis felineus]
MIQPEVVDTKTCGRIIVYKQGPQNSRVVILTVHDLGCNQNEMIDFVSQDCMEQLAAKCSWVHVLIPGQGDGDRDLPPNYNFPTMQQLGEAMGEVCDAMGLKQVVLFGEGAGANILARLAMVREDLVLGAVLIHCTGTAAGFAETIRDKLIGWKLNSIGMNPAAESYMLLHRFGSIGDATDEMEMRHALDRFRHSLREAINPRNLNKFIMSFMARTKIIEKVDLLRCPVLLITGSLGSHKHCVQRFYNALLQSARTDPDRLKHIELVQLDDVANVLRGAPDKVSDCLQYFIQGLGLASGIVNRRMSSTVRPFLRGRSLSMEEYDQPKGVSSCVFDKNRKYSTTVPEGDELEEYRA